MIKVLDEIGNYVREVVSGDVDVILIEAVPTPHLGKELLNKTTGITCRFYQSPTPCAAIQTLMFGGERVYISSLEHANSLFVTEGLFENNHVLITRNDNLNVTTIQLKLIRMIRLLFTEDVKIFKYYNDGREEELNGTISFGNRDQLYYPRFEG